MEVLFLGTGAGDFLESDSVDSGGSSHVARAQRLGGRNLRDSSSTLVETDLLIDFYGPRQLKRLGVDVAAIRHLLITHGHWDHFQPRAILDLAERIVGGLDVYGNELIGRSLAFAVANEWDAVAGRFRAVERRVPYRFHQLELGVPAEVGDFLVTPVHGHHKIDKSHMIVDELALNFIIERAEHTLFYGLDSSTPLPATLESLRQHHADLAILDATFGDLDIDPLGTGHHNFDMLVRTIDELREIGFLSAETRLIGSHISVGHVAPHDDIAADTLARFGFELAYDGMRVSL